MSERLDRSRLSDILIAQTIRLIEETGPLEDGEAMAHALHAQSGREERLIERARILSQRLQLDQELARWRELALYAWLGLAAVVLIMAYGIAVSLLGGGRSLNAVLAFLGVLGLHALTLLLWFSTLLFAWGPATGLYGRISLGRLLLSLVARIPIERGPHSLTMLRATTSLLRRSKLAPWVFGFISHSIWAASFVLVLIALWLAFSFQAYRLTWETTILSADFFIRFVQTTGWLPHLLGFPIPDTSTLLNPNAAVSDHKAWALWLVGCTVVYGLLVRIVLAGLSWLMWQRGTRALKLDTSDPYFRKILARFEQMEMPHVSDREQRQEIRESAGQTLPGQHATQSTVIIGFELADETAWPPSGLPDSVGLIERISGSGAERRRVMDALVRIKPSKLLLVCNQASSPDRGTERFLREAAACSGQCGLLLISLQNASSDYTQRWQLWLTDNGMNHIRTFTQPDQAAGWLQSTHD